MYRTRIAGMALVTCVPTLASALVVAPVPHTDAVRQADGIVRGTVVARVTEASPPGTMPITTVVVSVAEQLKGAPRSEVLLELAGGTLDGITHTVTDLVIPEVGDELAVFYLDDRAGRLSNVVGVNQWYFRLVPDPDDSLRRWLMNHADGIVVALPDGLPAAVRAPATVGGASARAATLAGSEPTEVEPDGAFDGSGRPSPITARTPRRLSVPRPLDWEAFRDATLSALARPVDAR